MEALTTASTAADTVEKVMRDRYSCRAFRPDPIPQRDIDRLLDMAQYTASWCNSQAWHVTLLSGAATEDLSQALTDWVKAGNPQQPDFPAPAEYRGVYRDRRRSAGFGLYSALGIERSDTEGRARQMMENFRFFGAPHVAIISSDAALGVYGAVDCGGYVSSFLTAAGALGIATCAQGAIAQHSPLLHRHLEITEDRRIVCAISFGYADTEHTANNWRTERATRDEFVTRLG